MVTDKRKIAKQQTNHPRWKQLILWLPIILASGFVPIILRLQEIYLDSATADILDTHMVIEIFSNGKATALCVLSILITIVAFLMLEKGNIKNDLYIKIYLISAGLFIGISLVATLQSEYKQVAWGGMPDRAEGFWVTLCYIILMLYTIYIFREYSEYKYAIGALSFVIVVNTVLGIFQYIGYDLVVNVPFFQRLMMTTEQYEQYAGNISSVFESGKVYGTMFHYNYMGSFGAMTLPLFTILACGTRGKKKKLLLSVVALCSAFLLFGSTSRGGLIGLGCAILVGTLIFGKKLIRRKKDLLVGGILVAVLLLGANVVTKGELLSRIPTLLRDIQMIFQSEASDDIAKGLPIQDIKTVNNETIIEMGDKQLILAEEEGELYFKDETGRPITYKKEEATYHLLDAGYENVSFYEMPIEVYDSNIQSIPLAVRMRIGRLDTFIFRIDAGKGVTMCDFYTVEPITLEHAESIGFKGKEKIGSARGYIWSRSLPLLKENLLWGSGPDTFIFEFPQNDFLGKWAAYDTPIMTVDKAHNLYLQYFINNGGLALLGFLVLVGTYIVQSLKLYALRRYYRTQEILGAAICLGIIGYLGAGFFNDSVISVAPMFWVLLGIGIAVNYLVSHE